MSFQISLEFLLSFFIQFVVVVGFFFSLNEKVKFLEESIMSLWDKQDEAKEKHEAIVRIEAKLNALIDELRQK